MAIYTNITSKTPMVINPIIMFLLSIVYAAPKRSVRIITLKKYTC